MIRVRFHYNGLKTQFSQWLYKIDTITLPVLQMGKLRNRLGNLSKIIQGELAELGLKSKDSGSTVNTRGLFPSGKFKYRLS